MSGGQLVNHPAEGTTGDSVDAVQQWTHLPGFSPPQVYPKGTALFEQSGPIPEVFYLRTGLAKLVHVDANGRERILELAFEGAWLGTAAVVAGEQSQVTAITCTRAVLHRMPAGVFSDLLSRDAALSAQIHRLHARTLCRQTGWIEHLTSSSSRQRLEWVIRQLIVALRLRPSPQGIRLRLPLLHWELAGLIAVTPEHLSRLLSLMEKEGVIRREKGWVIVPELKRLCPQCVPEKRRWCESGMVELGILDGTCERPEAALTHIKNVVDRRQ